jgi:FMN-dependent NADH-azoreductase
MTKLLHLDSSGKGSLSTTRPLTRYFATKWKEANHSGEVIYRDLAESDLPFVSGELVGAFYAPPDQLSSDQKKLLVQPDQLFSELQSADVYIFGVPLYNFAVPASFKAYIDLIVRPGKTFSFDGGIPKGLLSNKKAFIVTATGGDYSQEPMKSLDFVEPYVRAILGFIGVTDVTFIRAQGTNPEVISKTSSLAKTSIDAVFQPAAVI